MVLLIGIILYLLVAGLFTAILYRIHGPGSRSDCQSAGLLWPVWLIYFVTFTWTDLILNAIRQEKGYD